MARKSQQMKVALCIAASVAIVRADAPGPAGDTGAGTNPAMMPTPETETALMEMDPPYTSFKDTEYTPLFALPGQTPVEDLLPGQTVTSAEECAMRCSENEECNAATYVAVPTWEPAENCYLKKLAVSCELPEEAQTGGDFTDFYFLIADLGDNCGNVAGVMPNAVAPAGTPGADRTGEDDMGDDDFVTDGDEPAGAPGSADAPLGPGATGTRGLPPAAEAPSPSSALSLMSGAVAAVALIAALL